MKKRYLLCFSVLLLLLFLGFMIGCGGGDNVSPNTAPIQQNIATFTAGTDVPLVTQSIGISGGTIEIPSNFPIGNIKVEFPEGALPANTNVTLGYNTGTLKAISGEPSGKTIFLDTSNVQSFDKPISISVPFISSDTIPIPYYIDSNGRLHAINLTYIDNANHIFTFHTFHASWYTWILEKSNLTDKEEDYNTNFNPGVDGFQIDNFTWVGSTSPGGVCLGMTAFSLWYYINQKSLEGNLYPNFIKPPVYTTSEGSSVTGQHLIANRAHSSISTQWDYYDSLLTLDLSDEQNYIIIKNSLLNTGNPVMLYLLHNFNEHSHINYSHAVLAYGYRQFIGGLYNKREILIYNPNYHGQSYTITFDNNTKTFDTYEGFDSICLCGDGFLKVGELYENILTDAKNNFHSSGNAQITITSHKNGENVNSQNIVIEGKIESSSIRVTTLHIIVKGVTEFTQINNDGNFTLPITLNNGSNYLDFITLGKNTDNGIRVVPNNMATVSFCINYSSSVDPNSPSPPPSTSLELLSKSIPDGTTISPSLEFTQTYTFKNGSTTLNNCRLYFDGGDKMTAPDSVSLPSSISPGQEFSVDIKMTAPQQVGTYTNYWQVKDSSGNKIGTQVSTQINCTADYMGQIVEQSANPTLNLYQTKQITVKIKNTGTKPWNPGEVRLGTYNPQDRGSHFSHTNNSNGFNPDWLSDNRVEMQGNSTIQPGQVATFIITITDGWNPSTNGPRLGKGTYREEFKLVKDVGTPTGWFLDDNLSWDITVTDPVDYYCCWISQSPHPTVAKGGTKEITVKFKNLGKTAWNPSTLHLGADRPQDRNCGFYTATDSRWLNTNRIKMVETLPVQTGQDANFTFTITGNPPNGTYPEYFRLVDDKVGGQWFNEPDNVGLHWNITVGDAGGAIIVVDKKGGK